MEGKANSQLETQHVLFWLAGRNFDEHETYLFHKYLNEYTKVDDIRDSKNNSLLLVAVGCGNLKAVKILMNQGADTGSPNDNGDTPYSVAKSLRETEHGEKIFNLLNKKNEEISNEGTCISSEEENEVDEYNDNVDDVKRKLKVDEGQQLSRKLMYYIQDNGIIHKFLKVKKFDVVDFLLDITELQPYSQNREGKTLADIAWEDLHYRYLVKLLERDSEFPNNFKEADITDTVDGAKELKELVKLRRDLHCFIKNGSLPSVKETLMQLKSKTYMDIENRSALAVSQMKGKMNIYAYLLSIGADYKCNKERTDHFPDSEQINIVKSLLNKHCPRDSSSQLYKILTKYKVVGDRSEEVTKELNKMFVRMNDSELLRPLLKVLEHGKYNIFFDVQSEYTKRICIEYNEGIEKNLGTTFPDTNRCYIGAKHCRSSDNNKKDMVYRTLVHEICHLAASLLYVNNGLPYKEKDKTKEEIYQKIVKEIKVVDDVSDISTDKNQIRELRQVFVKERICYVPSSWQTEVIARCTEIIAHYGDEVGSRLMKRYLPDILNFYVDSFIPDCKTYSEDAFLIKPYSVMYKLSRFNGCLTTDERETNPFAQCPGDFEDKLLRMNEENANETDKREHSTKYNLNIFLLRTDNVNLCKLHVYQKLKEGYKFHVDRKCLFYGYIFFNENIEKFREGLQWESFEDVILVQENESMPDFGKQVDFLRKIVCNDKKRVIFIVDKNFECNNCKINGENISYSWKSMSDDFKNQLQKKKIIFQGKEILFCNLFGQINDRNLISSELLSKIMAGTPIGDDSYSKSQHFNENLFIDRFLIRKHLDDFFGQIENMKHTLFFTATDENELRELILKKLQFKISTSLSYQKKYTPMVLNPTKNNAEHNFQIICQERRSKNITHWIHYTEQKFYHWKSVGIAKPPFKFCDVEIHEEELMKSSGEHLNRVIIIADDPGSGKSTVLTKCSKFVKEKMPSTWVCRLSFSEIFSNYEENDDLKKLTRGNNIKDFGESFINIIHKGNQAEKNLLKLLLQYHSRVSFFLDGFDELLSVHRKKAIHLLRELKKNTKAQIWITSRTSRSEDLSIALETVPYSLKIWDQSEQCSYLSKLWSKFLIDCGVSKAKNKISQIIEVTEEDQGANVATVCDFRNQMERLLQLDATRSSSTFVKELGNVKFSEIAKDLLEKSIFSSDLQFLGKPLHVYLLGVVTYNNNFKYLKYTNAYELFSKFVDQVIHIFLKEKCGLTYDHDYVKDLIKRSKTDIEAIHKDIAKQSLGSGIIDLISLRKSRLYPYLNDIGLLNVKQNQITFFHKTFEEYFLAASIYDDMVNGEPSGEMISKIMVDSEFHAVKIFLNGPLEESIPKPRVQEKFFIDFNLTDTFRKFIVINKENESSHCIHLWKYIILNLESQDNESLIKTLISDSKTSLNDLNYWNYSRMTGLRILLQFEEEKWISFIFDFNDNFFQSVVMSSFHMCAKEDLNQIFKNIKLYVALKSCCTYCKMAMEKRYNDDIEPVSSHSLKCLRKKLLDDLFKSKDIYGRNMIFLASFNNDVGVFRKTLSFVQNIFGDKYKELLFEKDKYENSNLHYITGKGPMHFRILCENLKSEFQTDLFKENLPENFNDRANLWETVRSFPENKLVEDLELMKDILGKDLFINGLFEKNSFGMTILNYALRCGYNEKFLIILKEVRKLIDFSFETEKAKFLKWVKSRDIQGYNIATIAIINLESLNIKEFFENFRKILSDRRCFCTVLFEGILLSWDIAYFFMNKYNDSSFIILDYVLDLLINERSSFNKLIKTRSNNYGCNFIFIAVRFLNSNRIGTFIEKVKRYLDRNTMQDLFLNIDKDESTVFHYACLNNEYGIFTIVFDEVLKLCKEKEEEIKSSVMKSNNDDNTLMHLMRIGMKKIDVFEKLRNYIGDENMRELILRVNKDGETFLHQVKNNRRIDTKILTENILSLSYLLSKDDMVNFLLTKDRTGHSFYYYVKISCKDSNLSDLLQLLRGILPQESLQEVIY